MSKEIDFSKAPEGATHYSSYQDGDFAYWCKDIENDRYKWFHAFYREWQIGNAVDFLSSMRQITPQWSIYTNDKPLDELTDEQAATLFNHWRNGGETEYKLQGDNPWLSKYPMSQPTWCGNVAYRAIKQKSERELFVEACIESISSHSDDPAYYDGWFEQLFDSGKFKLVEQPK